MFLDTKNSPVLAGSVGYSGLFFIFRLKKIAAGFYFVFQ